MGPIYPTLLNICSNGCAAGSFKDTPENANNSHERGITCIFVGYKPNINGNCMIMVNPNNHFQPYNTQDTWLKQMYYQSYSFKSCNIKVLIIKGLDPELINHGSELNIETSNHSLLLRSKHQTLIQMMLMINQLLLQQ